jgi:UDP-2,3-diacylglucosamine pyrophosphatase LpxH
LEGNALSEHAIAHYRTIWISDIHLGTSGCQAGHLPDFLRHTESDRLFLVGDIIDGWALKRSGYWQQAHHDVVQKILRKARKGTHVTYIVGNHDEADGRRLLVLHGDLFDGVIQCARARRGCGHIHKAELREIDGIRHANDGDWVESLTALVAHPDGRLEILTWRGPVSTAIVLLAGAAPAAA